MPKSDPFWWEDAGVPTAPPARPLPTEVDVLIVGAGLTGLSAARTLGKAGKSVLALDAGAPGIGASSRNGGMIGGGHRLSIDEMEARYGKDVALGLLREAHLDSTAFVKGLIAEENIDCDLAITGRFRGLWSRQEYEAAGRGLERLQGRVPVEAEMVPRTRQQEEIATDIYAGGIVYPQHGGLNPAKYVAGLLAAARRHGALVQGDTPVLVLEKARSGFLAKTPRGTVRAAAVLAATNGYTPRALGYAKRRIIPVPSFIVATEPLGTERLRNLIPKGRMVTESRDRHCYYRPSPDGQRLIFGGRAAMTPVPEAFARAELKRLMRAIFPDLGDVSISHSWWGRTGFTFDFVPHLGRYNDVWFAMGYSGSGNAMAPYLGHKAALQILGDPERETAFSKTDFPSRWWHPGVPWFLPFVDVLFRLKDIRNNLGRDL